MDNWIFASSYGSGIFEGSREKPNSHQVKVGGLELEGVTQEAWGKGVKAIARYLVAAEIFERREFTYELMIADPDRCEVLRNRRLFKLGGKGKGGREARSAVKCYSISVNQAHAIIKELGLVPAHVLASGDCIWDTPDQEFRQAAQGAWNYGEDTEVEEPEAKEAKRKRTMEEVLAEAEAIMRDRRKKKGWCQTDWKDLVEFTLQASGYDPDWFADCRRSQKLLEAVRARAVLAITLHEVGMTYDEIGEKLGKSMTSVHSWAKPHRTPDMTPEAEEILRLRGIIQQHIKEAEIRVIKNPRHR